MDVSGWLTKCVIEQAHTHELILLRADKIQEISKGMQFLRPAWESFISDLLPSDEIWEFEAPAEYWLSLCGSSGYALVRAGRVIDELIVEGN